MSGTEYTAIHNIRVESSERDRFCALLEVENVVVETAKIIARLMRSIFPQKTNSTSSPAICDQKMGNNFAFLFSGSRENSATSSAVGQWIVYGIEFRTSFSPSAGRYVSFFLLTTEVRVCGTRARRNKKVEEKY